jgi:hypothetical protein
MPDSFYGVIDEHPWSGVSHYGSHLFSHVGLVTMHFAMLASCF